MVCPAYQSAFIYDQDELRKKFSYFQEDSTPKMFAASKTKYLIAEPTPYRKKIRSIQTVAAKKIFVAVPDSISGVGQDSVITADLDKAARSVLDTIMVIDLPAEDTVQVEEDSTYVITKDKEIRILKYNMPDSLKYDEIAQKYVPEKPKYYVDEVGFNTEQDNYMWYMRHSLILPDVRLAKMQAGGEAKEGKKKEKQGFLGFFKNLFKKKDKHDIDSAELAIPPKEEFDYVDTTATVVPVQPQTPPQKRSELKQKDEAQTQDELDQEEAPAETPKARKKKKSKKSKVTSQPEPKQEDEKKKEEDEDDGF
jgi:hypothetical protein